MTETAHPEMVEVPTQLDAVRALEAVRAHGGLILERPAQVLTDRIAHLEDEATGLAAVCDEQHQELMARDLCPGCAATQTHDDGPEAA